MRGERINPYLTFLCANVPNFLARRPVGEISQGAKIAYGRMMEYAGQNGEANPSEQTWATEIGVKPRQLRNYIKELESLRLIQVKRTLDGKTSNAYEFLRHPWMDEFPRGWRMDAKAKTRTK